MAVTDAGPRPAARAGANRGGVGRRGRVDERRGRRQWRPTQAAARSGTRVGAGCALGAGPVELAHRPADYQTCRNRRTLAAPADAAGREPSRAAPALAAGRRPARRDRRPDPARARRGLGGGARGGRAAARPGRGRAVRPRISFGAPLPAGMAADGELIDVVLTERWPAWRLREAVEPVDPAGLAAGRGRTTCGWPARRWPGRVAAADYRVTLEPPTTPRSAPTWPRDWPPPAAALLAARRLERQRRKGDGVRGLRPATPAPRRPAVLATADSAVRTRTRYPSGARQRPAGGGRGRPRRVRRDATLVIASIVRERLLLVDDLDG